MMTPAYAHANAQVRSAEDQRQLPLLQQYLNRQRRLPTIAIVGGPMSGKSTVLNAVHTRFGNKVSMIPEVATSLFETQLINPPTLTGAALDAWLTGFESIVFPTQLFTELWHQPNRQARVVITDRGCIDCIGYLPGGLAQFSQMVQASPEALYAHYDLVIFMESVAVSKPELFGKLNNEGRYESTPAHAASVNARLHEAWHLHPNLHYISSAADFDEIIATVLQLVAPYVDTEIERRWVLPALPEEIHNTPVEVLQGYLPCEDGEDRLRRTPHTRTRTRKQGAGLSRLEQETILTEAEWTALWEEVRFQLRKCRTEVVIDGVSYTIDTHPDLKLIILEVEFVSEHDALHFSLPDCFATGGAVEVTTDPRYCSRHLAEYGLP
jgi:CYTH domain-containing protein/predicted ATPase